jgi:hypothetical protein
VPCRANEYALPQERFSNSLAIASTVQGGFYFHPSDEDLSLGAPDEKAARR